MIIIMGEDLSSTNITDLINEDTEINDDVVNNILNELENSNTEQYVNEIENDFQKNDFQQNDFQHNDLEQNHLQHNDFQHNDFQHSDFKQIDFDNLVNNSNTDKINSILDDSSSFNILDLLLSDFKNPIIVLIIVILTNNSLVTNLLYSIINNIISNDFINNSLSLIIRAVLASVIMYIIQKCI